MAIATAVRDRRATVFKIGDGHYHTGQQGPRPTIRKSWPLMHFRPRSPQNSHEVRRRELRDRAGESRADAVQRKYRDAVPGWTGHSYGRAHAPVLAAVRLQLGADARRRSAASAN